MYKEIEPKEFHEIFEESVASNLVYSFRQAIVVMFTNPENTFKQNVKGVFSVQEVPYEGQGVTLYVEFLVQGINTAFGRMAIYTVEPDWVKMARDQHRAEGGVFLDSNDIEL